MHMYTRKSQGNPNDPSLIRGTKSAIVISSRYPFVLLPIQASSHHRIGQRTVEHAWSSIQLQRGWRSLYYLLSFMLTMQQSMSSASSVHSRLDEVLPHDEPQSSNAVSIASPLEARQDENLDTPRSSRAILMLKRWIPKRKWKSNKDSTLPEPDRVPRQSRQPADHQSRSRSPARVEDSNVGPSTMAANKRVPVSALP